MIHKQLDRLPVLPSPRLVSINRHSVKSSRLLGRSVLRSVGYALLVELHVELDEEKRLISDGGEEVELSDEVEDVRTTEAKVVGEGFAWLAVEDEAGRERERAQMQGK